MSNTVLKITDLVKSFGSVKALDKINLDIKEGEWVSIMGPSGSGKTTLLNILSLMDTITSGTMSLDDKDISQLSEEDKIIIRRERIGLVFQQFHLIPYLTTLENVMLAQYYHSTTDESEAKKVLEKVGLGHRLDHLPSQLSGGEQQRVCIARALINEPKILLADEPTGNLDEENEEVVIKLFQELHQEGKTIILITHNPDLGKYSDRTIMLKHGVIYNAESDE